MNIFCMIVGLVSVNAAIVALWHVRMRFWQQAAMFVIGLLGLALYVVAALR